MAKILISSSPPFVGAPLPSLFRHGPYLQNRKLLTSRVRVSLHEIPPIHSLDSAIDFNAIASRAESLLYTLADAAVSADVASGGSTDAATAAAQKNGGWFGFISEAMEFVLKVIRISFLVDLKLLLLFKVFIFVTIKGYFFTFLSYSFY